MLRHHRNVHAGERRGGGGGGGIGSIGGGEAEAEEEAKEEVRGSLSIGNPFSFVIRSRQTLRDRPAAERRISLKCCYKAVGPRWRHRRRESSDCTRDGNPSTMI
jgi:hypothetical protein